MNNPEQHDVIVKSFGQSRPFLDENKVVKVTATEWEIEAVTMPKRYCAKSCMIHNKAHMYSFLLGIE